jgi:superfamily II DNA/RNA helicase
LAQITNPDENFTQSLILAPTRELAIQIANDIEAFLDEKIKVSLVY